MNFDAEQYLENGLLVADLGFREEAEAFRERMISVFDNVATRHGVGPMRSDADLIDLYRGDTLFIWEQSHKMLQ